jgi:hypothetical protein
MSDRSPIGESVFPASNAFQYLYYNRTSSRILGKEFRSRPRPRFCVFDYENEDDVVAALPRCVHLCSSVVKISSTAWLRLSGARRGAFDCPFSSMTMAIIAAMYHFLIL